MADFLGFMKFAASDDAAALGKKASNFTDDVVTLLTEIRDELRAARIAREEKDDGR